MAIFGIIVRTAYVVGVLYYVAFTASGFDAGEAAKSVELALEKVQAREPSGLDHAAFAIFNLKLNLAFYYGVRNSHSENDRRRAFKTQGDCQRFLNFGAGISLGPQRAASSLGWRRVPPRTFRTFEEFR